MSSGSGFTFTDRSFKIPNNYDIDDTEYPEVDTEMYFLLFFSSVFLILLLCDAVPICYQSKVRNSKVSNQEFIKDESDNDNYTNECVV